MSRLDRTWLILAAMATALLAVHAHPPATRRDGPCRCTEETAWCGPCGIGHVAGLPVPSARLFEAIDAHGHDVRIATVRCQGCQAAFASDGFCSACRFGFVTGQLYSSALTYALARGQPHTAGRPCPACGAGLAAEPPMGIAPPTTTAWCAVCDRGRVGSRRFVQREIFEMAAAEFDRLQRAVSVLPGCETCAVAFMMRGLCPHCEVSYATARSTAPFVGPPWPPQRNQRSRGG